MDEKIYVYYLCVYETKASVDSITADWEPKQAYCMITNDNSKAFRQFNNQLSVPIKLKDQNRL